MNRTFWTDKKVLITGHTGFKGSWLCLLLKHLGARLTGYSLLPPTQPSLFETADVGRDVTTFVGDIRDLQRLQAVLDEAQPEIVIHMAAQSLVRRSYGDPIETYSTNVMGTVHILEACRHCRSVQVTVVVTSDKCYENREWVWPYRETDPLGGSDPYSTSKACAELVTAAYRASFMNGEGPLSRGVSVATVRAGNVIGGGDWAEDRIIPDLIRAFVADTPALVRNPDAVRPWQHVLDPLAGYLHLCEKLWDKVPGSNEAWNFGPDTSEFLSVGQLAEKMCALWGANARWIVDGSHLPEHGRLVLDSSKARERLVWKPQLGMQEALESTVAWYRAHAEGEDMRDRTQSQIRVYEGVAPH